MTYTAPLPLPCTAAGRLLYTTPVLKPLSVDMAKGRLTVLLPPDMVLRAGMRFGFVDEADARAALESDAHTEARMASADPLKPVGETVSVRFFSIDGDRALEVEREHFECCMYYQRFPNSKGHGAQRWYGSVRRTDALGLQWSRHISRMVVDDFGNLFEVAAS